MKLVFHHIPKTGGSTVEVFLQEHYYTNRTRVSQNKVDQGRRVITDSKESRFFSSHDVYHPAVFKKEHHELYFTWVRNPIDMVYSSFFYFQGQYKVLHLPSSRPGQPRYVFNPHETVEDYIDTCLASDEPFYPEGYYVDLKERGFPHVFDFVGRCHRMDQDLASLCELAGMDPPGKIATIRVSDKRGRYRTSDGMTYLYRRAELAERLSADLEVVREWLPGRTPRSPVV